MRDIYTNPTIARLAADVRRGLCEAEPVATVAPEPVPRPRPTSPITPAAPPQLLFYGAYSLLGLWVFDTSLRVGLCGGRRPGASSICAAPGRRGWRASSV